MEDKVKKWGNLYTNFYKRVVASENESDAGYLQQALLMTNADPDHRGGDAASLLRADKSEWAQRCDGSVERAAATPFLVPNYEQKIRQEQRANPDKSLDDILKEQLKALRLAVLTISTQNMDQFLMISEYVVAPYAAASPLSSLLPSSSLLTKLLSCERN